MLPACELSIGTSPQPARPTSTASNTLRIDGSGTRSASGKSASAPSSEKAPASPWYATMSTTQSLEAGDSFVRHVLEDCGRVDDRTQPLAACPLLRSAHARGSRA